MRINSEAFNMGLTLFYSNNSHVKAINFFVNYIFNCKILGYKNYNVKVLFSTLDFDSAYNGVDKDWSY